jgi:hypothetical protein
MPNEAQTLTVKDWPYQEIEKALAEFQKSNYDPTFLWVGRDLWFLLIDSCDAEQFWSNGACRILFDATGILEPHEFMFTRK